MLEKISLTQEEEQLLEEHYKSCEMTLIRSRSHAVLLNHEGYHAPEIARIMRYHETTVRG